MRTCLRPILAGLALAALLIFPSTAVAESSPEAQKWIDGLTKIYEQPFELDMSMDMSAAASQGPMQVSDFRGHLTQKDAKHMRMDITMKMLSPQGEMEMKMLTVHDGTTLWNEMDTPMGKQVTKMDVEVMEAMAQSQGMPGAGTGNVDPVSQIKKMAELMDFELVSQEGGEVTLQGTMTEENQVSFGNGMAPGSEAVLIVFDEASGFPKKMRVGGEEALVEMTFTNLKILDAADLDPALFEYTPAEGVPVIDVAKTMRDREALRQQTKDQR